MIPALPSAFVLIVSHRGPLESALLEGIGERSIGHLPFAPTERVRWWSQDGQVAFLGFAAAAMLETGLPWDIASDGIVAFTGLPVPRAGWWDTSWSWATQLRRVIGSSSMELACADHFGVFTAVAVDGCGAGVAATDQLGVGVLYRADGPGRTAIASRASLAGIAARHPALLTRSIDALGWLLSFDNVIGDGTGYAGVRALPARSVVSIGPDRAVTIEGRRAPGAFGDERPRTGGKVVGNELRQRLRTIAAAPEPVSVGLTAGRDSRLLLAHILETGLTDRFRFLTWDLGGDDVRVAVELAAEHHLDHRVVPADDPVPLLDALAALLRRTEGMLPASEAGRVMPAPGPFVSGIGGALLGAQYGAQRRIRKRADVEAALVDRVQRRADDTICTTDAIGEQTSSLVELVAAFARDGWDSQQILPLVFLDHRLHRWQGTVRESGPRADIAPLLSAQTLATGLLTPHQERRRFSWHDRLTKQAWDPVRRRPYGNGGGSLWTTPEAWPATAQVLRVELLEDSANPVFEMVSHQRAAEYVSSAQPPPHHVGKQLVNALGIARWANGGDER